MSTKNQEKPKVLALMPFQAIEDSYLTNFKSRFVLDELKVSHREEAQAAIKAYVADFGPYDAFIVLNRINGTKPFEPFTHEFLSPLLPHCKIIATASEGYDEFPIEWLTMNGIWLCTTRNSIFEPTADMAMFLTLVVIRDTPGAERCTTADQWRNCRVICADPSGLKLGVIGMGAFGKHYARKASMLNMHVQYYNRCRLPLEDEHKHHVTYCESLEELLRTSDVISINCPLNPNSKDLLSHNEFAQMKDGAIVVNTARRAVIDDEALIAALESGKVARAGFIVFGGNPKINSYFVENDRCIILPHLVGLMQNARRDAEKGCLENITSFFSTGRPVTPVNNII